MLSLGITSSPHMDRADEHEVESQLLTRSVVGDGHTLIHRPDRDRRHPASRSEHGVHRVPRLARSSRRKFMPRQSLHGAPRIIVRHTASPSRRSLCSLRRWQRHASRPAVHDRVSARSRSRRRSRRMVAPSKRLADLHGDQSFRHGRTGTVLLVVDDTKFALRSLDRAGVMP